MQAFLGRADVVPIAGESADPQYTTAGLLACERGIVAEAVRGRRYQQAGYRLVGAAPTGRAARELSSRAGMPASTLHRLADDLCWAGGFGAGRTVLIVERPEWHRHGSAPTAAPSAPSTPTRAR
jgi:hypothetical protein